MTETFKPPPGSGTTLSPMPSPRHRLRPFVSQELTAAAAARRHGAIAAAWIALERAHILSQPSAWLHTRVHWSMLTLAIRTRDARELAGQVLRIAVAGIGSLIGRFPRGNTGRARVPMNQPMPIPPDLASILRGDADDLGVRQHEGGTEAEHGPERPAEVRGVAEAGGERRLR